MTYKLNKLIQNYEADSPPALISFRQAIQVLRSPVLGGVVLAFFVITRLWPAGFDARLYYLRWPPPEATTPYWVYLLTYPLSWLGWPLSWQVLVVATIFVGTLLYALRGNPRWWIIILSSPFLYNAWWGQIEIFSLLGILTGLLLLQKKLSPVWIAAVWLLLSVKIQANYGLILLFTFWIVRQRGAKALLPGIGVSLAAIVLTLTLWPGWPTRLMNVYGGTQFGYANASLWPYGIAAWLVPLMPMRMSAERRLRLTAAASLMGSPYFSLHHCLGLMALTDYPWLLLVSWLPIVMIWQTRDWSMYAWIIPLAVLIVETRKILLERRHEISTRLPDEDKRVTDKSSS